MKPLTANLKYLYQYRFLWIFHFTIIIGILMMLEIICKFESSKITIVNSLQLICFYGLCIGATITNILSKPFAFCLPGHTKTVQKTFFLVWLTITIIFSLLTVTFLFFMDINIEYALFFGFIGLISLSYWLGTTYILRGGMFLILTVYAISIIIMLLEDTGKIIEPMLLAHPWAIIFISGIPSYLIYRAVGCRDNARMLAAMPWIQLSSAFDKRKQIKFRQERMRLSQYHRLDRASELAGNFFSKHIRSNNNSSLLAHLWGQVYLIIGPIVLSWRATLLSIPLSSLILCLLQEIIGQEFMFALTNFIVAYVMVMVYSTFQSYRFDMSLLISRREYLWRRIVFLFTVIFRDLGFIILLLLLFNILSGSLLPILFPGGSFSSTINWILLIIPVLMIPFFGGLFIIFRKTILIIALIITFVIAVAISSFAIIVMGYTPFIIDLLIVLSGIAITWGFHLIVLYYDSMKRSLC